MMKRVFLLSLAILLFVTLPAGAYAANETEMSTVISYAKSDPPPSPSSVNYEINIPASVTLNEGAFTAVTAHRMYITANYINLNAGQSVDTEINFQNS